jgi:hypothetical protein
MNTGYRTFEMTELRKQLGDLHDRSDPEIGFINIYYHILLIFPLSKGLIRPL